MLVNKVCALDAELGILGGNVSIGRRNGRLDDMLVPDGQAPFNGMISQNVAHELLTVEAYREPHNHA